MMSIRNLNKVIGKVGSIGVMNDFVDVGKSKKFNTVMNIKKPNTGKLLLPNMSPRAKIFNVPNNFVLRNLKLSLQSTADATIPGRSRVVKKTLQECYTESFTALLVKTLGLSVQKSKPGITFLNDIFCNSITRNELIKNNPKVLDGALRSNAMTIRNKFKICNSLKFPFRAKNDAFCLSKMKR